MMTENPAGKWENWQVWVVRVTERYLSWRKKRRLARKARQKKRNVIVDWLDAIGSAVVIVLLINQYLLQAYQIPSPSMEPTLLVTDRIFVNKIVYGPELIPGMLKIPGPWLPQRGDVIIFESPEYISSGPVVDVLQRVIYMVTLSLVDIDKDENGQPKHHFLIKRAIGMPGDRIRMNQGNVEILTPGSDTWIPEVALKKALGFTYNNVRLLPPESYSVFKAAGIAAGLVGEKFTATADQEAALKQYYRTTLDS
ncbi:MAG TPA: signal peptidase I, partial [Spirochaetia bacterium]|nr:signal peptidase I [Spirochaetia bacterium]